MENRLRILLLSGMLAMSGCASMRGATPPATTGAPASDEPAASADRGQSVITPQVERRQLRLTDVDTSNWEVGGYAGSLSVEDFEVNVVSGARLAYHISEDFFAEGLYGSANAGLSSYERLSGSARLLTPGERRFRYYSLGFGWNMLPGEVFLGARRAFNSDIYLTAGAGATRFAGSDHFTVTLGAGARVQLNDWLATHLDLRDHILEVDVVGRNKQTHNLEATLSLTAFF